MAHDSYHCQNENITGKASLKTFPFPTQRHKRIFVGADEIQLEIQVASPNKHECPMACRPTEHPDWEEC